MRYLLDTHALLWSVEDDPRLGTRARKLLQKCETGDSAIADISLFEISMLLQKSRISLTIPLREYLNRLMRQVQIVPVSAAIAADSTALDFPHGDPFDRIITATALCHKLPLITRDQHIIVSGLVETIW